MQQPYYNKEKCYYNLNSPHVKVFYKHYTDKNRNTYYVNGQAITGKCSWNFGDSFIYCVDGNNVSFTKYKQLILKKLGSDEVT
jgi:hypothetical protein